MQPAIQPAPTSDPTVDPSHGFPFGRLVKNMRYATVLCLMLGVFITIIEGDGLASLFESLFVRLVLALCIGLLSYLVVDAVRLALLRQPDWGAKQWLILLAVVVVATPISTYADEMRTEFVCIPRPVTRSARPDGGDIRYRLVHTAALWKGGTRPRLKTSVLEGDIGLAM